MIAVNDGIEWRKRICVGILVAALLTTGGLLVVQASEESEALAGVDVDVQETPGGEYVMEVVSMGDASSVVLQCGDEQAVASASGDRVTVAAACDEVTVTATGGGEEREVFTSPVGELAASGISEPNARSAGAEFTARETEDPDWQCTEMWDGTGTPNDPYVVTNDWELQCIYWAGVHYDAAYLDAHYVLGNDIDASLTGTWETDDWEGFDAGEGWFPIGQYNTAFTGSFDGNGHVIVGISADHQGPTYASYEAGTGLGVFGNVYEGAEVRNVGVVDAEFVGSGYIGALVGTVGAEREQTLEVDHIAADDPAPVIANVWVEDSYVEGSTIETSARVGGVVGSTMHGVVIEDARVTDTTVVGNNRIGGFVGHIGDNGRDGMQVDQSPTIRNASVENVAVSNLDGEDVDRHIGAFVGTTLNDESITGDGGVSGLELSNVSVTAVTVNGTTATVDEFVSPENEAGVDGFEACYVDGEPVTGE